MKRLGPRAGWAILVLVCLAVLAFVGVRWGGTVRQSGRGVGEIGRDALAEAVSAYEAKDWRRAADLARSMLKSKKDDPGALRVYARASARLEHDSAAASIYSGRLDASKLEGEDRLLLGLMNARAGRLEERLRAVGGGREQGER